MFASFQFEAVHHQLKPSTADYDPATTLEADDEGLLFFSYHLFLTLLKLVLKLVNLATLKWEYSIELCISGFS